jgi:hypothetical protein
LELILIEEKGTYEIDIKDPNELLKKKKKFQNTLDSEFMLESDNEELDEEVK